MSTTLNKFISEQDIIEVCKVLNDAYQTLYNERPFFRIVCIDAKHEYTHYKIEFVPMGKVSFPVEGKSQYRSIIVFDSTRVQWNNKDSVLDGSTMIAYYKSEDKSDVVYTEALQRPILPQYWKGFVLTMVCDLFRFGFDKYIATFCNKEYLENHNLNGCTFAEAVSPTCSKWWQEYKDYSELVTDKLKEKLTTIKIQMDDPHGDQQFLELIQSCVDEISSSQN